jgi:formylglycine-generating enzyme required for sulfatase activity
MPFHFVPGGTFTQGTPGATDRERPYTATLSRDYFVSRTEVTQGQWVALSGGVNPSCFQSATSSSCTTTNSQPTHPVERVSWWSAVGYANALSAAEGLAPCYTLPESGCTGSWQAGTLDCGTQNPGVDASTVQGCTGYRLLTESEFDAKSGGRTQPVGTTTGNGYGLFDMSGNLWEWVWDWVYGGGSGHVYPSGSATDWSGPASGSSRGIRGGSWGFSASDLRSALRSSVYPGSGLDFLGVRLARTAP